MCITRYRIQSCECLISQDNSHKQLIILTHYRQLICNVYASHFLFVSTINYNQRQSNIIKDNSFNNNNIKNQSEYICILYSHIRYFGQLILLIDIQTNKITPFSVIQTISKMRIMRSALFLLTIVMSVLTCVCGQYCTNNLYYDSSSPSPYYCVQNCTQGKYKYDSNKTCVNISQCSYDNNYVNKETGFCVPNCTSDFYQLNLYPNYQCVRTCPQGYYISKSKMACTTNCRDLNQYYDPNTRLCEYQCSDGMLKDQLNGKCAYSCVIGTFFFVKQNICTYNCLITSNQSSDPTKIYGDNILQKCVAENQCSYNTDYRTQTYADFYSRLCVELCPQKSFAHPDTKKCQSECFGNYPFKNFILRTCTPTLDQSINDYFKSNLNFQGKVYAISQFQFILIIVGVVLAILIIVLGVIFYKYYLKKRIFRKYLEPLSVQDNIDY